MIQHYFEYGEQLMPYISRVEEKIEERLKEVRKVLSLINGRFFVPLGKMRSVTITLLLVLAMAMMTLAEKLLKRYMPTFLVRKRLLSASR